MRFRFKICQALSLLSILLISASMAFAASFKAPDYTGYINDQANVLSPQTEQSLNGFAEELDEETGAQVAVLTIDTLGGTPVEDAALQVARSWGVGGKKKNSGLLILLAVKDRALRTEVGYGLEGVITDGTSGQIQDAEMIPYFKSGNYDEGIARGALAYMNRIAKANDIVLSGLADNARFSKYQAESERQPKERVGGIMGLLLFLLNLPWIVYVFLFLLLWNIFSPTRRG